MSTDRRYQRLFFVLATMPLFVAAPTASLPTSPSPAYAGVATCDGRVATIVGTPGDDILPGTSGVDVIVGLGGNDTIKGKSGADIICGGGGEDTILGGKGRDRLFGGGGKDTISGGSGGDKIFGGSGKDTLDGGNGADKVVGGKGGDVLAGGAKGDTLLGKGGDDDLTGDTGVDTCDGGSGFNTMRCDDYVGDQTTIDIINFDFDGGTTTVAAGAVVVWRNTQGLHTTESVDELWDSGDLDIGDSFAVTFDDPGAYDYFCYYHPFMTGTITVTP